MNTSTLLFIAVSALLFAVTSVFFVAISADSYILMYLLCISSVLTIVITQYYWTKQTHSAFDPFTLFLLSLLLFFAGHQILFLFGLTEKMGGILYSMVPPRLINVSLYEIFVAFVAFGLGSAAVLARPFRIQKKIQISTLDDTALRHIGWAIVSVAAIPMYLTVAHNVGRVWTGGYSHYQYLHEDFSPANSAMRVLSEFFIPGCCLIIAGSKQTTRQAIVAAALIGAASLPSFFVGERSRAIMPLLACAWVWHRTIRPLSGPFLVSIGAFFLAVVFPTIRAVRDSAGSARGSLSAYVDAFLGINSPVVSILDEMGQSGLRTVVWVYELVPATRPFAMGQSYLDSLSVLVPHLSGNSAANQNLSAWLVGKMEPTWAAVGGGYGFSYLAEAYYNFGWVGVVTMSIALGYIVAKIALRTITSGSSLTIALVGCLNCIILFYPRAETRDILREVVWYSLCPVGLALLYRQLFLRQERTRKIVRRRQIINT